MWYAYVVLRCDTWRHSVNSTLVYAVVHVASCNIHPKCSGPVPILCRVSVLLVKVRAFTLLPTVHVHGSCVHSTMQAFWGQPRRQGAESEQKEISRIFTNHGKSSERGTTRKGWSESRLGFSRLNFLMFLECICQSAFVKTSAWSHACQNSHFGICQSAASTCSVLASIVTSPSTCAAGSVAVRCHVSRCCQTQHRSISRQHQPTTADIQFRICKCNCGFGLHKSTSLSSMLSELSPESISGESNQFAGHDAWSSEMHKDNLRLFWSNSECPINRMQSVKMCQGSIDLFQTKLSLSITSRHAWESSEEVAKCWASM